MATVPEMTGATAPVGCYPGTFDPPTVAHLAVAEAAVAHAGLVRLDLVVSRVPLGKDTADGATLARRVEVLEAVAATRPWLGVVVTDASLIADIARAYDAVVMGADKWRQVCDPSWYSSPAACDAALAALPRVLVAARGDDRLDDWLDERGDDRGDGRLDKGHVGSGGSDGGRPDSRFERLAVEEVHLPVSSTAIREGRPGALAWVLPDLDRRPAP